MTKTVPNPTIARILDTCRETVEGPEGAFRIEFQDDERWSVEQILSDKPLIKGSTFVRDSAGRMGWGTRDEAIQVARGHAGLIPPPDRRGLVAHTRRLYV